MGVAVLVVAAVGGAMVVVIHLPASQQQQQQQQQQPQQQQQHAGKLYVWNVDPVTKAPLAANSAHAVSGIRWEQQRVEIEELKVCSDHARELREKAKKKLDKSKKASSEFLVFLRSVQGTGGETTVRAVHRYLHYAVNRGDDREVLALKGKGKQGAPPRIAAICDGIALLLPRVQQPMHPVFIEGAQVWDLPPFVPFEDGVQRVALVYE